MTADEFVKKLAELAPSVEKLLSRGYSREFAEKEENRHFLQKKPPEISEYNDPLLDLICNYHTSDLEIGIVTLEKKELAFPIPSDKILVGMIEVDPLVINKKSGAVELLDHDQPEHVIAECAISGGKFLEALILFESFEPPHWDAFGDLSKEQAIVNNEAALKRAAECAKVAGITPPPNIYEVLLGCDCWTV